MLTIGMFGTCGNSQWRVSFIEKFIEKGITFFNPVVENWEEYRKVIEANHLLMDDIILFPVTDETYSFGSLAEVAFSITQAIKSDKEKFVVIYVAPKVSKELFEKNAEMSKDSNRARSLCLEHLETQKNTFQNVYVVKSLEEMDKVCFLLYDSMSALLQAREISNK